MMYQYQYIYPSLAWQGSLSISFINTLRYQGVTINFAYRQIDYSLGSIRYSAYNKSSRK